MNAMGMEGSVLGIYTAALGTAQAGSVQKCFLSKYFSQ